MTAENKFDKAWAENGVVESPILMGDLGHTHNNLLRLACLSELNRLVVSGEALSIEIPKEKPQDMVHKVLWLSVVIRASKIKAIKNGAKQQNKTECFDFTSFNESLIDPCVKYKSLDSRQRS